MTANLFGIVPEEGTEAHQQEGTPSEKSGSPETTPVEQESTAPKTEDPTPDPEPAPSPEPTPEPAKPEVEAEETDEGEGFAEDGTGFQIGNKVYRDLQSADQAFRQQRGRAQAEAKRAKELQEERDRLLQENAALKVKAESPIPQTPQPDPASPGAPAPPAGKEDGAGLTEPLTQEEINELIAEEGADKALLEIQARADRRFEERLGTATAPIRRQEEVAEAQKVAMEQFTAASEMTGPDGQLIFPELSDETLAPEIVAVWDKLVTEDEGFRDIALSASGVRLAVREWQAARGTPSQPASPPHDPGPTGPDANDALAGMSDGQRAAPTAPPAGTPPPRPPAINSEEAVRKLIRARENPVFGVTVESRQ
jgi:hypothetical protein